MHSGLHPALGVAAALGSPLCFSLAFFLWENWRGSSYMLNLVKCSLASAVFVAAGAWSCAATGTSWFAGATADSAAMLVLSGLAGIVVGDTAALQSLKMIGARRYILVDSTKPFFSGLLGWLLLGERITLGLVVGMCITTLGVVMVCLDKEAQHKQQQHQQQGQGSGGNNTVVAEEEGLLQQEAGSEVDSKDGNGEIGHSGDARPIVVAAGFGLAAIHAILDVGGSIITRVHGAAYTNLEVNTIRFGSAALILGLGAVIARLSIYLNGGMSSPQSLGNTANRAMTGSAWQAVLAGCLLGTFFTPWLSNAALFSISYPVFATLVSVGPIYSLPLAWIVRHQPITPRAALGAMLAIAGIIPLYHLA